MLTDDVIDTVLRELGLEPGDTERETVRGWLRDLPGDPARKPLDPGTLAYEWGGQAGVATGPVHLLKPGPFAGGLDWSYCGQAFSEADGNWECSGGTLPEGEPCKACWDTAPVDALEAVRPRHG